MEAIQNELIAAIHSLTGISSKKIIDYGKEHNIINILRHPTALETLTESQIAKIAALNKLISAHRHLSDLSHLNTILLNGTDKAKAFFSGILSLHHDREYFMTVFLNVKCEVIDVLSIRGTLDSCPVYPRDVLQAALSHDTAKVMFGHNHPTGHCNPSREDVAITQRFVNIFNPLRISVLDHIIVGENGAHSMAEQVDLDFRQETGDANYNVFDLNEKQVFYEVDMGNLIEDEWER